MATTNHAGATRALQLTRLLRAGILVACATAAGAAWIYGAPTVAGLALVVAVEETWETSVVVAALRRQVQGATGPRHRVDRT